MSAMLLLFACIFLGVGAAHFTQTPQGLAKSCNWWVIRIALPALVMRLIARERFSADLWFPVAGMWLSFFVGWAVVAAWGKARGWDNRRVGALTLVAGVGNTSFMGYPMIQAFYGAPGLAVAVVADQLGSIVALSTAGVAVASLYSGQTPSPVAILRKTLIFPPFVGLVAGVVAGLLGGWPDIVDGALLQIGQTMTPLALFAVGMQLKLRIAKAEWEPAALGVLWKLAAAPALCFALGALTGAHGLIFNVTLLQAAASTMIAAAIMADEYGLETELANAVLGATIVLSLASVPLLHSILPAP